MRLFQRASRRAGLPVTITKGFSPHLKFSIMRAMKLGLESQSEEAIFSMDKKTEPAVFLSSMNEKLPEGVRIKKVEELP
jgi:radical SAM-linked protein